jgi:hypothetical protein
MQRSWPPPPDNKFTSKALEDSVLKVISTLSILVPLTWNGIKLKEAGTLGWLFFGFLLAGFLTDMSLWYIQSRGITGLSLHLFNAYSCLEAIFFFWLLRYLTPSQILAKAAGFLLYGSPVVCFLLLVLPVDSHRETAQSGSFVTFYEVSTAFLAGFTLLAMAEKGERLYESWAFWLILGIFFYCFCTFFVMTVLGSRLSLSLWWLNNLVNILTYLFYSLGWWNYRGQPSGAR